jgi:hypothetical protein
MISSDDDGNEHGGHMELDNTPSSGRPLEAVSQNWV